MMIIDYRERADDQAPTYFLILNEWIEFGMYYYVMVEEYIGLSSR